MELWEKSSPDPSRGHQRYPLRGPPGPPPPLRPPRPESRIAKWIKQEESNIILYSDAFHSKCWKIQQQSLSYFVLYGSLRLSKVASFLASARRQNFKATSQWKGASNFQGESHCVKTLLFCKVAELQAKRHTCIILWSPLSPIIFLLLFIVFGMWSRGRWALDIAYQSLALYLLSHFIFTFMIYNIVWFPLQNLIARWAIAESELFWFIIFILTDFSVVAPAYSPLVSSFYSLQFSSKSLH